jgi:hypothetical protein
MDCLGLEFYYLRNELPDGNEKWRSAAESLPNTIILSICWLKCILASFAKFIPIPLWGEGSVSYDQSNALRFLLKYESSTNNCSAAKTG